MPAFDHKHVISKILRKGLFINKQAAQAYTSIYTGVCQHSCICASMHINTHTHILNVNFL